MDTTIFRIDLLKINYILIVHILMNSFNNFMICKDITKTFVAEIYTGKYINNYNINIIKFCYNFEL